MGVSTLFPLVLFFAGETTTGNKVETELHVSTPSAERSVGQAEAPRTEQWTQRKTGRWAV